MIHSLVLRTALRRSQPALRSCGQLLFQQSAVPPLHQCQLQQSICRIHTARPLHAPDRPTSLTNMLASDVPPPVQVSSVGPGGIKLADGLVLTGPVVFLEGTVLLWDVPNIETAGGTGGTGMGQDAWDAWTRAHWEVFDVVVPKPEVLIFGTGARVALVPDRIRGYVKALGIQMDVMDTKNACSTYNLLAEEGRRVAAALLPIESKKWTKERG